MCRYCLRSGDLCLSGKAGSDSGGIFFTILLFIVIFFASGCEQGEKRVIPAFYHWQTEFLVGMEERSFLKALDAQKLYVKFFDIDWDFARQEPVPLAVMRNGPDRSIQYEIVPCIFITNRTFLHLEISKVGELAKQTVNKIEQLAGDVDIRELQFDCDWTLATKQAYFAFLREVKILLKDRNVKISATIRLHQLKYPETTGVPPVDRGALMVYNVGDLESWITSNSILTTSDLLPYLVPFEDYSLQLDIALPVFAWGVVYRNNRLIKLINNLRAEMLLDSLRFLKLGENRYELKKSTYIKGYFLYKGDRIRTEAISPDLLEQVAELLVPNIASNEFSAIFYHLDSATIKYFNHEQLRLIIKQLEN